MEDRHAWYQAKKWLVQETRSGGLGPREIVSTCQKVEGWKEGANNFPSQDFVIFLGEVSNRNFFR